MKDLVWPYKPLRCSVQHLEKLKGKRKREREKKKKKKSSALGSNIQF